MKNIIKLMIAVFAAFATTACMDEKAGNDATWTKAYEGVMTTTNQETSVSSTDNATITIYQGSMFKNFIDITISDVRFAPMMPDVEFIIKDMNFELAKVDDENDPLYGTWAFNKAEVVPTQGGIPREEYTMRNFRGNVADEWIRLEFDVNIMGALYHASFDSSKAE